MSEAAAVVTYITAATATAQLTEADGEDRRVGVRDAGVSELASFVAQLRGAVSEAAVRAALHSNHTSRHRSHIVEAGER